MAPRILVVVPARMGSKRLPGKNRLCIEPDLSLTDHAVYTAVESELTRDIFVLTDDVGYESPWARRLTEPPDLAGDHADIADAVAYAADVIELDSGIRFDFVVTLQPAVLARSGRIMRDLVREVIATGAHGGITAARTVPWQWQVIEGEVARNAWHPGPYPRSAEAPPHLAEVNAVQVAAREVVGRRERWAAPLVFAELPPWAVSLDIDEPEDLAAARDLWPWARSRLRQWRAPMHHANAVVRG